MIASVKIHFSSGWLGGISESSNFNGMNLGAGNSPLSDGSGQIQSGPGADDNRSLNEIDYTKQNKHSRYR